MPRTPPEGPRRSWRPSVLLVVPLALCYGAVAGGQPMHGDAWSFLQPLGHSMGGISCSRPPTSGSSGSWAAAATTDALILRFDRWMDLRSWQATMISEIWARPLGKPYPVEPVKQPRIMQLQCYIQHSCYQAAHGSAWGRIVRYCNVVQCKLCQSGGKADSGVTNRTNAWVMIRVMTSNWQFAVSAVGLHGLSGCAEDCNDKTSES